MTADQSILGIEDATPFEHGYTAAMLKPFPGASLHPVAQARTTVECTRWCAEGPRDQHLSPEMGERFWRLRQAGELLNYPRLTTVRGPDDKVSIR